MELFHANKQWSTRPADQRFASLQALYEATAAYARSAVEKPDVLLSTLRTEAIDGDVQIVGKGGMPAKLTNWSFGQLCARTGVPAGYARELPATLAVQNINHGLAKRLSEADGPETANLLFHSNGGVLLRSINSDKYSRIWNYEVAERLLGLQQQGWKPAMPTIRTTDADHPALYASDHDMFAFVTNDNATIDEPGNPDGLMRGVIVANSEVGASTLLMLRFLYRAMCGNHIIWGAEDVLEVKVRHVGDARERWQGYRAALSQYLSTSASWDEAKIRHLKTAKIGDTKQEVLDTLFGKRALNLSRKTLDAGYEACLPDVDGSPMTPWGIVQGLTRHSQTLAYADARTTVDKAAGRILDIGF